MFKNVLLAIDLANKEAHDKAFALAKQYVEAGSELYVVSVIPPVEGGGFVQSFLPPDYDKRLLEQAHAALCQFSDNKLVGLKNVHHLVAHGKVYEKVTDIASELNIDLIITMASMQKHRAFGPNVARIVRNSDCSVIILR